MLKPIKRSRFRILAGRIYFTLRRYLEWRLPSKKYCINKKNGALENIIFEHRTPVYRQLPKVDMILQENKAVNLSIAAEKISGVVIRPGEAFSYWRLIGRPTGKKGYLPGLGLFYGTLKSEVGGGLCQLSNMVYWMALHSPLTVTERYRHSYDVFPDSSRTQPFGSGATCVYPYRDLQLYNGTGGNFQIEVFLENGFLVGRIRSDRPSLYVYRVYEREHSITHENWGGYVRHNAIYREKINPDGETVADEYITENHAIMMYSPFLENVRK